MHMNPKYTLNTQGKMVNLLIKFPIPLIERMDSIVASKAYGSRAELIRECIRKTIGDK